MKDFLRTASLSPEDLSLLLDRAIDLERDPDRGRAVLRGETVGLYFEKPSTRTRLSFETAVARLGGHAIFTTTSDLQTARGETLEDTARVGSRYARAWVLRTYRHEHVVRFAAAATVPVINALTNDHHPCQSLADLLTLREHWGSLAGRTVAWIGPGNNVAHSFIEGAMLAGMRVRVATPPEYAPDVEVMADARDIAKATGGALEVVAHPEDAARGADAIYTDAWVSMGDDPRETEARRAAFERYRVDDRLLGLAAPDAVFLHCMPAYRGAEVSASVLDGRRSLVLQQAESHLHTSVALLEMLLRAELSGSAR